jgi:hypothetical protein
MNTTPAAPLTRSKFKIAIPIPFKRFTQQHRHTFPIYTIDIDDVVIIKREREFYSYFVTHQWSSGEWGGSLL